MNVPALTSFVASFVRVLGSTVLGKHSAVLVGGEGGVGGFDAGDPDEPGEQFTDAEAYGAPGIVFRPRPPERIGDETLSAEAYAVRTGGGLVPLAWRDLRLNRRFSAPKPGSVALVGYGGGFLALDDNASKESVATLYVPYDFSGGVATKAHLIMVSPDEGIAVVHANGSAVTLNDEGLVLRSDTGAARLILKGDQITMQAQKTIVQGNLAVGANPVGAVPLLPGAASPPCPSLFVSPV